jgi:hypothetical protein
MALQLTVDKIDTLPEPIRALYKPAGDKFQLDLQDYEDPVNLKSALDKERNEKRDAVAQAKAWRSLGKTPEEILALVEAQSQAERDKLTKAGEWDKLRGQMTEQHQTELAKREESAKTLRGQLERHLVDAAAATALAAAEASPELLMPHVKAKVKVIEENGEFLVRVVDAAGNPRVDGKGEFLSITELVSEMRQNPIYAPCFPKAQGSNAPGSLPGARAGSATKGKIDGTEAERVAYLQSKYPDLR